MRPEKPNRVDTNPKQDGLAGLSQALSGLDTKSLPPAPATQAPVDAPKPKRLGRVVLRREKAHRGGRTVIVVDDFPPSFTRAALDDLAHDLRHAMGTGGTVRERTIEIQGDQPGRIRAFLEKLGFQVAGVT
jgi:translation initiation factor 1